MQEKRYLRQLLGSFVSLYQVSSQPNYPLQKVSKDELDQVLNLISQTLKDQNITQKPNFTFEEISKNQFLKLKTEFLSSFEEDKAEDFFISPKEKYDLIIDNTGSDIQKGVNSIIEIINKRDR